MAYPPGLEPIETASVDELRRSSSNGCGSTLRHAYENVPHYRGVFDAPGVHPEDIRDLADLRQAALHHQGDLRDNYPFGMFAVPREQVARIHASSGTTGTPDRGRLHGRGPRHLGALMARRIRAAGGRPGDIVHIAYGYGLFTGGLGAHVRRREARLHRRPRLGRHDRAPGAADRRLRAATSSWSPRRTCSRSSTRWSGRASTRGPPRWRSASSAPSRGPTTCAARSSERSASTPSTSTGCPR